jgi:MFS family permease
MSPTFRSLQIRNYRLWWTGALISNTGTWMQRIAQDWLVLTELTDDSGVAVGIVTALQFAPLLLLAPVAGLLADRFDRRRLLQVTNTLSGGLAALLGVLAITGAAQLWQVYVIAGVHGAVGALDAPARQAFASELVGARDLPNAVGLNSASFHGGRLVGPGIAGLLIHWFGTGPVFGINAATFAAAVLALARMRTSELHSPPSGGGRSSGAIRDGVGYLRRRPDLCLVLAIAGTVGAFGLNVQLTSALMARLEFDRGSGGYGLLGSVMAIGALGGALLAARRQHPDLRLVIGAAAGFGATSLLAAVMPGYWGFAVALIPLGLSALTLMTAANALVQLGTPAELRGRVMAVYLAAVMGGAPVGAPVLGWLGQTAGPRWSVALGGVVALLAAAAGAWVAGRRGWLSPGAPGPVGQRSPRGAASRS